MQASEQDLVSVVIPVYNAEKYLEGTLDSVFAQTYSNLEIVAVDDGSSDHSVDILRRFPGRITLIEQPNKGVGAARNRGVHAARGKWIAFLDADDIWAPEKLQRQLDACGGFVWSHTDSVFMGGVNDGRRDSELTPKYSGHILERLICSNFVGTSTVVIQRQCVLDCGGFDESLRSIQDWDLWIRVASKYEIGYVNESLLRYRVHPSSASRSTRKTLPNHLKVIDKVFAENGPAGKLRPLLPYAKANSYNICAQIAEEEGDLAFALRCSLLAWGQLPLRPGQWKGAAKALVKYVLAVFGVRQ